MRITRKTSIARYSEIIKWATKGGVLPYVPDTNHETNEFNCWGYTALSLGWISKPKWLSPEAMMAYIERNTREISPEEATIGDIVALYLKSDGELEHTAIVIGGDVVIQKAGSCPIEVTHTHTRYRGTQPRYYRNTAQRSI